MEQKRYDDMHSIMLFSRIFSEQMLKCMENRGMIDEGFHLDIHVGKSYSDKFHTYMNIRLQKYQTEVSEKEWADSAMDQVSLDRKWMVMHDPYAKAGSLPPEVHFRKEKTDDCKGMAEKTGKPYPPDGLWLSSRDDYPVLDGGQ